MIPYGRQYISEEDVAAVTEALKSDYLTQGPRIEEFEASFAKYIGSKYAVAVSNGTAALHLSILALRVNPNKKVITSPITFAASANCVLYAGGSIDFVDINPNTYTMDLDLLEKLLEENPDEYEGVIPVDLSGFPVDLERLKEIAHKYGLWILEDACHAPGAYFIGSDGKIHNAGNGDFADLAIFSFHPVKHIASGEGGMITTNDEELYNQLMMLRTHGITKDPDKLHENHGGWYYEMQELGYNYRLTDIQAALGLSQLHRAEAGLRRRHDIADKYDLAFKDLGIVKQHRDPQASNAFHLYIIEVENRKELYDFLKSENIFPQVHYIPIPQLPYYRKLGFDIKKYPNAGRYYERCLSIPMYPTLLEEEQDYVIDKIRSFLSK